MKKISTIVLLALIINTSLVYAFSYNDSLESQVASMNNTELDNNNNIVLAKDSLELQELYVAPNYTNEKIMFLNTGTGLHLNQTFNANFTSTDNGWPDEFNTGPVSIQFEGSYNDSGNLLAYTTEKVFISYNRNNTWGDIQLSLEEELLFADFGPNFTSHDLIYFITDSGLYSRDADGGTINTVIESAPGAKITDFDYPPATDNDSVYFIVKGNKVLKTEDFGSNWFEEEFTGGIKQFEIIPDGSEGDLAVITMDNKFYYSTLDFNFYELTLPSEITEINMVRYAREGADSSAMVILTDQGFYISYDSGSNWVKLQYALNNAVITDFSIVKDGTQYLLFAIMDNQLYRDITLSETFGSYMAGIDTETLYASTGEVISANILDLYEEPFGGNMEVTEAMPVIEEELNGQTITYSITADGENWVEVISEETISFENPGTDLRWKAVLNTADRQQTPVLINVMVDFGLDVIPEEPQYCSLYTDVPLDDPNCAALTYVTEQGIFEGYPDGTFGPEQEISRAETVKVIVEGFNITLLADDGTDLGFSDVIVGEWYMPYLNTAKQSGIVQGYPDGTFKPEQTVNYIETLKIFFETAKVDFMGAEGEQWYQKYLDYALANNLVPYEDIIAGMKRIDVAELFYQWSLL